MAGTLALVCTFPFTTVLSRVSASCISFSILPGPELNIACGSPIQLEGNPVRLGNRDTIIERKHPTPPLNFDDGGTIEFELVALSLKRVDLVDFGGNFFGENNIFWWKCFCKICLKHTYLYKDYIF